MIKYNLKWNYIIFIARIKSSSMVNKRNQDKQCVGREFSPQKRFVLISTG